ncbi:hypothetical protein DL765_011580 [Monosporascus sp. GIB2]|nr:hypothetical protein DL765_011580 [Monosporascus sp. GIB2]
MWSETRKMAIPTEGFMTVLATALVVLVTLILVRQRRRPQLALPTIKSLTLRIDDVPADHTDDLDRNLRFIVEQDPALRAAVVTLVRRSLAPRDKDYLCATISITTPVSAEDLSARLRRAGNSHPYSYTCKFEGITPLYEHQNGADVDVIAVPGLGSHALGSWKSPNSDEVWLRDFLPKDVPNIRVLLYGYDTTLPGSLSKQSIEDLGGAFLEQIIAFRARDGALVRARRRRSDANSDLSKASYGLLFFGVPNLGLRNHQLSTLVRGQPNEALIHDLLTDSDSEPSTFLKRLADQFSESCKGHYRVVTFFERTLSPTLELDQDRKWRKTGRPSLLVTEKSATSTGLVAVAEEDNIALNTDHSGLVKYDSRSQGDYTIVRERLRRLVDEAKQEVAKRFAEHNMDGRPNVIDDAADGTCKWLLKHETLAQWTRQHRGLLWIKGKPGSGKSTIMKYALREIPALYGPDTLAFSFFFHGRGHELQRTPLGLFRSLLHELLRRVPGALPDLIDHFEEKRKTEGEPGEKWQWHLQPLQGFLKSSLTRILKRFPVILFIDALDECGEQAVELIRQLKNLLLSIPPTDSRFGICFSCRNFPILELDGGLTIRLDTENKQDIVTFVQADCSKNRLDADVGRSIINRANGVFMWAHLVLKQSLLLHLQGESPGKINAEIERVPQDLNGLYNELIKSVKDRSTTLKLIQWICFSARPLTTDELQWAMAVDPDCAHNSLDECQSSDAFITNDNIDRRINTLSCGLAEIVPSNKARVVQFIHQSVRDFFVKDGLMALDNATKAADLVVPAAHCRLSRSCIRYFRMAVLSRSGPLGMGDKSRLPLLHYATTSWVSHVKFGEPAETSPGDLLDLLGWPLKSLVESWVRTYKALEFHAADCPSGENTVIHILARHGLTKLLLFLLDAGNVDVDAKDKNGRTPLSWAAENGYEAVLKMLLDTGKVDVDAKDENDRTPLSLAAMRGHEAVVKMLLDTGKVDVDAKDKNGQTPLSKAAENGHKAVVKMLLGTYKVELMQKISMV